MEQRDKPATRPVMYLVDEDWSPRFEGQFFTVKMEAAELLSSAPASTANPKIGAKSTFPAYYYKIDVFCGYTTRSVFRRYSQFYWLYNQLPRDNSEAAPVMPPEPAFSSRKMICLHKIDWTNYENSFETSFYSQAMLRTALSLCSWN